MKKKKKNKKARLSNHFYLGTSVGFVHVNMDPDADQETIAAVKKMAELAYNTTK